MLFNLSLKKKEYPHSWQLHMGTTNTSPTNVYLVVTKIIIIVAEVKLNPMHQLVLVVLWSPEVIIKFKCNSVQATILKLMQSKLLH